MKVKGHNSSGARFGSALKAMEECAASRAALPFTMFDNMPWPVVHAP